MRVASARWVRGLLVVAGLLGAPGGCRCVRPAYGPPPVSRCESPEGLFAYFRECIHSGEYTRAWWCLSREGRRGLPQHEFEAGFQSYRAVRELITGGRIEAISVSLAGDRADLVMENPDWGVRRTFRLVREPIGALRLWQVDLTRGDLSK